MPRDVGNWRYGEAQLQRRLWTPDPAISPVWFDPLIRTSLIFSGTNITGAQNLSGNGFDLVTGSCRFDTTYNGFLFNGTSEFLRSTATRILGADFAIVCELNPASATQLSIATPIDWDHASGGGLGPFTVQGQSSNNSFYFTYSNGSSFFFANTPQMPNLPINKWSLCTMFVINGTAWNYLNGALVTGFPRTGGGSVTANARLISLGTAVPPNSARVFNGRIGSVRIFTLPSLIAVQREEGRVAWRRFGITGDRSLIDALAANHPFANRPPLTGD